MNANNTCEADYEKLYVDCPPDDDYDVNDECSKDGLDLANCRRNSVDVEHGGDMLMFTQEFTLGKLCNKMFKKLNKNRVEKTQKSTTMLPAAPHDIKPAVAPKRTTTITKNGGKNTNRNATAVPNGQAFRPKYVPGTLTRTRPINAMMGMGLGLSGQHGLSNRNNGIGIPSQFNTRQGPTSSSAARPIHSSGPRKNSSNTRTGQFGPCPFLPPCSRKKKVIFAFTF